MSSRRAHYDRGAPVSHSFWTPLSPKVPGGFSLDHLPSPFSEAVPLDQMTTFPCPGASWSPGTVTPVGGPEACRRLACQKLKFLCHPHHTSKQLIPRWVRGPEVCEYFGADSLRGLENPGFAADWRAREGSWLVFQETQAREPQKQTVKWLKSLRAITGRLPFIQSCPCRPFHTLCLRATSWG